MAEPLKHGYDVAYLERLASVLRAAAKAEGATFRAAAFRRAVLADEWEALELKQRMHRITDALGAHVSGDYRRQLAVLRRAAPEFDGFLALYFPDFVERFGSGDWDASLDALEWFTRFSSSELGIRPFIIADQARGMARMAQWARHADLHVRRLASEGCRPRLPWATALPSLKTDPAPVLPILLRLRDDPSEYVRRSVANNLNDIAKDHPALVRELAREWLADGDCTDERRRLVKHACRTLLKRGDAEVLLLFGFRDPAEVAVRELALDAASIAIGGALEFSFALEAEEPLGRIRLEYAVDYVKASGRTARKVFQLSEFESALTRREIRRHQRFADLSTRRHYPGEHGLAVIVNGCEKARVQFELVPGTSNARPPRRTR